MDTLQEKINDHIAVSQKMLNMTDQIHTFSEHIYNAMSQNASKVLICGNGGSASDSQHIAAEMIGRFYKEREAIPFICLNTDTSVLTCLSNDYAYSRVFGRQIEALGNDGDVLFVITTSGNSSNIVDAIEVARRKNMTVVGMLGKDGGEVLNMCDHVLLVPSNDTARIQEMHILCGHLMCGIIEDKYTGSNNE